MSKGTVSCGLLRPSGSLGQANSTEWLANNYDFIRRLSHGLDLLSHIPISAGSVEDLDLTRLRDSPGREGASRKAGPNNKEIGKWLGEEKLGVDNQTFLCAAGLDITIGIRVEDRGWRYGERRLCRSGSLSAGTKWRWRSTKSIGWTHAAADHTPLAGDGVEASVGPCQA